MCAGINGIGLSMVIPSGQSMVADYYPEERRGAAFGALYLTGALGAMLGAPRANTPPTYAAHLSARSSLHAALTKPDLEYSIWQDASVKKIASFTDKFI